MKMRKKNQIKNPHEKNAQNLCGFVPNYFKCCLFEPYEIKQKKKLCTNMRSIENSKKKKIQNYPIRNILIIVCIGYGVRYLFTA